MSGSTTYTVLLAVYLANTVSFYKIELDEERFEAITLGDADEASDFMTGLISPETRLEGFDISECSHLFQLQLQV